MTFEGKQLEITWGEENNHLAQIAESSGVFQYWLGARKEVTWQWSDGSVWGRFTNWRDGLEKVDVATPTIIPKTGLQQAVVK